VLPQSQLIAFNDIKSKKISKRFERQFITWANHYWQSVLLGNRFRVNYAFTTLKNAGKSFERLVKRIDDRSMSSVYARKFYRRPTSDVGVLEFRIAEYFALRLGANA